MTEIANFTLEQGLERYQQGENAASLLPEFKELSDRSPKNAAVWSCLAWLCRRGQQFRRARRQHPHGVAGPLAN
jgi:Flp pilus assembly protein TadD